MERIKTIYKYGKQKEGRKENVRGLWRFRTKLAKGKELERNLMNLCTLYKRINGSLRWIENWVFGERWWWAYIIDLLEVEANAFGELKRYGEELRNVSYSPMFNYWTSIVSGFREYFPGPGSLVPVTNGTLRLWDRLIGLKQLPWLFLSYTLRIWRLKKGTSACKRKLKNV